MKPTLLLTFFLLAVAPHVYAQSISSFAITPGGYQGGIYAYCVDGNGQFVPYCTPAIYNGVYLYTEGHNHDDPTHPISTVTNNGQPNGASPTFQIAFNSTIVAQDEWIEACTNVCGVGDVWVYFPGYGELSATVNMTLIGQTGIHPTNHYAIPNTLVAINDIVNAYATDYGTTAGYQIPGVNDMSLPGGGIFDLNANWTIPHQQHSYGLAVDFRANGAANSVLPQAYNTYVQYCKNVGLTLAFLEAPNTSNQHIHCSGN